MAQNKLPTILVLATTFPRWENDSEPAFDFNLSRRLARKGFNIIVLVPGAPGALPYEEMDGVEVYRFSYFYPKSLQKVCYDGGALPNLKSSWLAKFELPFFLFFQFIHIGLIIKKKNIDAIHCHWIVPQGFFCAVFKKIFKIPLILSAHAGDVFAFKNRLIRFCARFAVSESDFCTANSKATQKALKLISDKKNIEIIPMGVDLNDYSTEKHDPSLREKHEINGAFLLAVGRFVEKKGFKYLIDAMPMVLKKHHDAKLCIIGFGPEEKSLKTQVIEKNLENSVIFPGKKSPDELSRYFATADILIGPSIVTKSGDTEGLGVVFLEAFASKTAVIACNVGGIPDIVIHGKTGLLVEEKNPQDISEKVNCLLSDVDLRNSLVAEAYTFVKNNFSWDIVQEKFTKIYNKTAYENMF